MGLSVSTSSLIMAILAAELVTFLVTAVKGSLFLSGGQSSFSVPTQVSLVRLLLGTTTRTSGHCLFLTQKVDHQLMAITLSEPNRLSKFLFFTFYDKNKQTDRQTNNNYNKHNNKKCHVQRAN